MDIISPVKARLPTKNNHLQYGVRGGRPCSFRKPYFHSFCRLLKSKMSPWICEESFHSFWELSVIAIVNRQRKLHGHDVAYMDGDACLVPVRDALQEVGFVDSDMQLLVGPCETIYGKHGPELHLYFCRVSDRRSWRDDRFQHYSELGLPF